MDRDQAIKIATVALNRAQADDMRTAAQYCQRLNKTGWWTVVILAWIDTYIAHAHPDHEPGSGPVRPTFLHVPTGALESSDEVSPGIRWAGQLIAARAADDEAAFRALLSAPGEGTELGDAIMCLLHVVATSLNLVAG